MSFRSIGRGMSYRNRFQANEDLIIILNAKGSTPDSSADQETGLTTKLGIDAPRPSAKSQEEFERTEIPTSKRVAGILEKMRKTWRIMFTRCGTFRR